MADTKVVENLDTEGMERHVGLLGLLWASEGSIIGSGWLFGALTAASIAGPSAIVAWVIASAMIIVLALVHAELGGLFPVSGGTQPIPALRVRQLGWGNLRLVRLHPGRRGRSDRGRGGDPVRLDVFLRQALVQLATPH